MASQTVNFLPPSYITTLTTTVTSMSGSIAAIQADNAVQASQINSMSGSISSLNSAVTSMSGSIAVLNTRTVTISVTGSFNAISNYTYSYNLVPITSGSAIVNCILPSSPLDGDKVTLIDGTYNGGWGNTFYSCRVVPATGTRILGDAAPVTTTWGGLFNYRGKSISFVYNASLLAWIGTASNRTVENGAILNRADDPLTGWWVTLGSAISNSILGPYIFHDATQYPILQTAYQGFDRENFYNNVSITNTLYIMTGGSTSSPYSTTYVRIQGSSTIGGPETSFGGNPVRTLYFPSSNFTYLVQATDHTLSKRANDLGSDINIMKRLPNNINLLPTADELSAGGEFINRSPLGPIEMFTQATKMVNCGAGFLNNNIQGFGPKYYTRKQMISDILSPQGVTFSVPVVAVRKSHVYTGANLYPTFQTPYTGGSTQLTDICCAFTNYNTPGSNVTLSGFTGGWSVCNGYYPNGVSCIAYGTCKENDGRCQDYIYNGGAYDVSGRVFTSRNATGTSLAHVNRFFLIKDTSSISDSYIVTTGPYKNYGVDFGEPVASVNHRVYSDMPYNEWHAALLAVMQYAFTDGRTHIRIRAYFANPQGQLISDWTTLSSSISTMSNRLQWGNYAAVDCTYTNVNTLWGSAGFSGANYSLINNLGEINNPYQISDYYNNYVLANNSIALNSNLALPLLNYCETGTLHNLYIGWSGPAPSNTVAQFYSSRFPRKNTANPSATGGSYLVGKLFPFISPFTTGAYANLYSNPSTPDTTTWIPAYGNGVANNRGQLNFAVGKLRSELCDGKTVFYIRMSDIFGWSVGNIFGSVGGIGWTALAPPGYTGPSGYTSNPQFGGFASEQSVYSAVTKWMNSFPRAGGGTGPDAIIIDIRSNGGGGNIHGWHDMFGADRQAPVLNWTWKDDGFSPKVNNHFSQTGPNAFWSPTHSSYTYGSAVSTNLPNTNQIAGQYLPSLVEQNFGSDAVIKNCNIVLLDSSAASSYGEWFPSQFFGNLGDRNLGNGVKVNIIGEKTYGNYGSSTSRNLYDGIQPTNSRRFNLSSFAGLNSDFNNGGLVTTIQTGPLRGNILAERNPAFNYINATTGPDRLVGSASTGAIPSDCSIPVYDMGFLNPPSGSYYISQSRPTPVLSDASTWRDVLLEQSIKQAIYM